MTNRNNHSSAASEPVAWRIMCTTNGATGYLYTEVLPFEPGPGVNVRREPEPLYSVSPQSVPTREQIAALARRFWSIHPSELDDLGLTREEFYASEMTKLFASSPLSRPERCDCAADDGNGLPHRRDCPAHPSHHLGTENGN